MFHARGPHQEAVGDNGVTMLVLKREKTVHSGKKSKKSILKTCDIPVPGRALGEEDSRRVHE